MRIDIHKKARRRVKFIKAFYIHTAVYAIMGAFFFTMNAVTDPFHLWFYFPLIPWGVALAFHYLFTFGIPGSNILSADWEEREYEKQLDRLGGLTRQDEGHYLPYGEYSDEELDLPPIPQKQRRFSSDDMV